MEALAYVNPSTPMGINHFDPQYKINPSNSFTIKTHHNPPKQTHFLNPPKILQAYIQIGKTHGSPCLCKPICTHRYQPFWHAIKNKPFQPNLFTIKTHHNPPKQTHFLNPPKIPAYTHPICRPTWGSRRPVWWHTQIRGDAVRPVQSLLVEAPKTVIRRAI